MTVIDWIRMALGLPVLIPVFVSGWVGTKIWRAVDRLANHATDDAVDELWSRWRERDDDREL